MQVEHLWRILLKTRNTIRLFILFLLGLLANSLLANKDATKEQKIYATYNVVPLQESTLVVQANGVVVDIFVDVGSQVKKGDILLKLKDTEQKDQVRIAKSELEAVKSKYEFSKLQFERYGKSSNVIDGNTLDKVRLESQSLGSEVARLEATVLLQEELLNNLSLKAPFSGVIAKKFTEVGNGVVALNSPLFLLQSLETKLILEFDSSYAKKIVAGNLFYPNTNTSKPLQITKVYPSIDSATRKMKAEIVLNDRSMISGMFGDGFILLDKIP